MKKSEEIQSLRDKRDSVNKERLKSWEPLKESVDILIKEWDRYLFLEQRYDENAFSVTAKAYNRLSEFCRFNLSSVEDPSWSRK